MTTVDIAKVRARIAREAGITGAQLEIIERSATRNKGDSDENKYRVYRYGNRSTSIGALVGAGYIALVPLIEGDVKRERVKKLMTERVQVAHDFLGESHDNWREAYSELTCVDGARMKLEDKVHRLTPKGIALAQQLKEALEAANAQYS